MTVDTVFQPVKIGPWRREYASERVRVVFRDTGDRWDLADIEITLIPVKQPSDTSYRAVMSGGKMHVTAGIDRPVSYMRPKDIDQVMAELQLTKRDIGDIEDLIRAQFPDIPVSED